MCLDALREAEGPMRARSVAEYAMLAKGLPVDDARIRAPITEQVRWALMRLERRGLVRKIVEAPETWWELAQQAGQTRARPAVRYPGVAIPAKERNGESFD